MSNLKLFGRHRDEANAADVATVAASISNINDVAAVQGDVVTVANNLSTVTDNADNIGAVADNIVDVVAVANNESDVDIVASHIADVGQVADIFDYHESKIKFNSIDFRLNMLEANRAEIVNINGVTVHQMDIGDIVHAGDGFMPIPELKQHDLVVVGSMDTAEASKNVNVIVRVIDKAGTTVKTTIADDVSVPDDQSEFSFTVNEVLSNTDVGVATEGRLEIEYGTATATPHSGKLQLRKMGVIHV